MAAEGRVSDPRAFETLNARIKQLEGKEAAIGWFENAQYEGGTPVAYVASINELGRHARPFMRPTIAEREKAWGDTAGRGAKAILEHGETSESVMEKLAGEVEGDIAATITRITAPPLSPITLLLRYWRRLGRKISGKTVGEAAAEVKKPGYQPPPVADKPLVDRGIMLDTLSHEVRDST